MSDPIRFVMLGGFLGAGKTTTIGRLAHAYQQDGLRVGIVTNDQAADLVDTHLLRSQGFDVGEVAGACFCCNFSELTHVIEELELAERPQVILAEPVGSCTDLVATVIRPLRHLFEGKFEIAPYGVILKPSHGRRILKNEPQSGFSPKAAYIFRKQLEEADFVILNRIDQLDPSEIGELEALIDRDYPGMTTLRMSARTGEGFAGLLELLDQRGNFGRRVVDLDYDVYAEGEAELGWLNSSLRITAPQPFSLDAFLLGLIEHLRQGLDGLSAETAHLKTIALWEGAHAVANLVSRDASAELSLASDCQTRQADVIVNARVAADPDILRQQVAESLAAVSPRFGICVSHCQTQSFRPGRPVPTHRFGSDSAPGR